MNINIHGPPKRIIPFIVAVVLIFTCALPASADEFITTVYDGYWIDLLDYTQVFDTGNYGKPPAGVSRLTIDMPYTCTVGIVDMVVGCYLQDVDLYVVHPRDGALKLNKIAITGYNGTLYRYYLAFPVWDMSQLVLQCDTGNDITWLEFHAVRVSTKSAISSFTPLNGTVSWWQAERTIVKNPNVTTPAYCDIYGVEWDYNDFELNLTIPEWKEYDFVDMQLYLDVLAISSISATFNGSTVPLDISYIENASNGGHFLINVTIDMRYLFRGASRSPTITIQGKLVPDGDNFIQIVDCHGFVLLDTTDPLYYRFKSVTDALKQQTQDIVAALSPPASDKITDYKDSASQQAGKVDAITDSMGTVSKPDAGDMNFSMNGLVNANAVTLATTPLAVILNNKYLKIICIMSFTLCIAGYILFGKKG